MPTSRSIGCFALALWLMPATAPGAQPTREAGPLAVFPASIALDTRQAEHRIGVMIVEPTGREMDLGTTATYSVSPAGVAAIDGRGMVRPLKNGSATIRIDAAGRSATIPVTVRFSDAEPPAEFTREVVPVLTKAGCNQGACHGGQHGKGGFRLSLRGFDPAFDHPQIVQSAEGRRVVLSDPERSILLMKPILAMDHGGGERLQKGSRGYETVLRWLDDGAPGPSPGDPVTRRLEVWPTQRRVKTGDRQPIIARAHWSDGRIEDVTDTAQFDSLNDSVAAVTPDGVVTAKGLGETHIMVRFAGQATVVRITQPYAESTARPAIARHNFIDDRLAAKWQALGIAPSPLADDATFFRRIHLDTLGTLPAPADIKAFLADADPKKRDKAIDRVLDRPEFVDYWTLKWGDLLRINRTFLNDKGMWSFHNWVREALRENRPIDQFVREIIAAEGSTFTDGPTNYYRVSNNATDWAETTSQVFLGVRMQCAKCHQHPFEKWSQDDYYGMAAFFARVGTKNSQEFGLFGRESIVFLKSSGEVTHPRKNAVVPPHPFDGPTLDDPVDRRRLLADWMTSKDNPYFARNLVNRFWGYYFGRGLVEPLDDMRATNPATNPELLDALAADFAEHRFDFKHLLRTFMRSRAYQLSSAIDPANAADAANTHFARYTVKRLTAEQLADAIDLATGTREKYPGLPLGVRAIQLPDTSVRSFLMDVFGRPSRRIACECERTVQPNIAQAMHLLNGDFLSKKIADPAGRIEKDCQEKTPLPKLVDDLTLLTLSRPASAEDRERAQKWIASAPTPKEGLQDFLWALLNSREFLFNH